MPIISKTEINYARDRFRREFGREATPQAGRLIRELLNTILNDPDPRWKRAPQERERVVAEMLKDLPKILATIAEEEGNQRQVTAPDVLHWLGIRFPDRLRNLGFVFDKD